MKLGETIKKISLEKVSSPMIIFDNGKVTVKCSCGKEFKLPITIDRYFEWKRSGEFVQNAFPELTAGQRELLLSGICEKCWGELFPYEE